MPINDPAKIPNLAEILGMPPEEAGFTRMDHERLKTLGLAALEDAQRAYEKEKQTAKGKEGGDA